MELVSLNAVINTIIFATIGIVIMLVVVVLLELATPKTDIWKEIVEKQNLALAILIGAFLLGIANIIASVVH